MIIRLNRRQAEYVRDVLTEELKTFDDARKNFLPEEKMICEDVIEILEDGLDA